MGTFRQDLGISEPSADMGAKRRDHPTLPVRAGARLTYVVLSLSRPAATILASMGAALAAALSIVWIVPGPCVAVPALLCGWGRCRMCYAVLILSVTAAAAYAPRDGPFASALALATLLVLWWVSRAARAGLETERRNARRDALTGCLTLRAFHEALGRKLAKAREQRRPVALAYLDLDHFKEVNDRYGHAVGDALLQDFATELSKRLLTEDVVGRLGGDEFAVLLAEVHGPCAVQRFERLVHEILGNQAFPVTASIGALIIDPGASVSQSELIIMTDQLMYEAKRSGKATVRTNLVRAAAASEAGLAA